MKLNLTILFLLLLSLILLLMNIIQNHNTTLANNIYYRGDNEPRYSVPSKYVRPIDNTIYSIPEWYLVFSPQEYADLLKYKVASDFPFFQATSQYWQTYNQAINIANNKGFNNSNEKIMLYVIGLSTSLEYSLRGFYEHLVGSFTYRVSGRVQEDDYSAAVAQNYVNFIKSKPWYEFDFWGALKGVWTNNALWGKGLLRKFERKYILSSEYFVKTIYAKLIEIGSHAKYGKASTKTAAVISGDLSKPQFGQYPKIKQIDVHKAIFLLPRLDAFKDAAVSIAPYAHFYNIAGNKQYIALSVIANQSWDSASLNAQLLFSQDILTLDSKKRYYFVVPVTALSNVLESIKQQDNTLVEHIYDY